MILSFLLAAASPQNAVDAERAFAAMAQTEGQWTAFRAYAAPNGWMFVPEPVNAQAWLKDRKDPPQSVMWWPAESWVSCDGSVAVNTGPWVRQGGRDVGYFTTVWARQQDGGWKWLLDQGAALSKPRAAGERARVRRAKCVSGKPAGTGFAVLTMEQPNDQGMDGSASSLQEDGRSRDESLRWKWRVLPDKSRRLAVELWTGAGYEKVLEDKVGAP